MLLADAVKDAGRAFLSKLTEETGASGTQIFRGAISSEDYNAVFDDSRAIDIYNEMLLTEPIIKSLMNAVKLPILTAEPRIEPASDESADVEIAEMVESNLLKNDNFTYSEWLSNTLRFLDYGYVICEKVFEVVDSKHRWKSFEYRKPETITAWFTNEDGKLDIIEQQAFNVRTGKWETALKIGPAGGQFGKIFHVANEQQGHNYRGISILRQAYRPFKLKKEMVLRMAIQAERGAVGMPRATFKRSNPSTDLKNEVIDVLQNLRGDAKAYVIQTPDYEVDFIGGKSFMGFDLKPYVQYQDQQMVSMVLASFLEQGKAETGSFAKQKSDIELFLDSLDAIANHIEDVMNGGINGMTHVRQLVDLNVANVENYPKYKISKINGTDLSQMSDVITALVNARGVNLRPEDEHFLREKVGLPEVDIEDLKNDAEERKQTFQQNLQQGSDSSNGDSSKDNNNNLEAKKKFYFEHKRGKHVTPAIIAFENKVLDLDAIRDITDTAEKELKRETKKIRDKMVLELVNRGKRILSGNKSIKDIDKLLKATTVPFQGALVATLTKGGVGVFKEGRNQVRKEIGRQDKKLGDVTEKAADAIGSIRPTVKAGTKTFIAKLEGEFEKEVLRQAKTGQINTVALKESMGRVSQKVFEAEVVDEVVRESFGMGRTVELKKQNVEKIIRSEVLDTTTCSPCFDVDGMEVDINSPEFEQFSRGVFDGCDGNDKCRGLNVALVE